VLIGPDDRARGEVVVKDLASGAQQSVGQAALPSMLRDRLAADTK
jgi:histidyl-tRNA synthetase